MRRPSLHASLRVLGFAVIFNVGALAIVMQPAHAQASCSVTVTINSLRNTNDNQLNTVPNPLTGACTPSQWQYDLWSKVYDGDSNLPLRSGPSAANLNIPCQPTSSTSCPVAPVTVSMGTIADGEYIRITTDRDLAGAPSFNIAECGTVTPVMTTALGSDIKNTVSAVCDDGGAITVSVDYLYSSGG